MTPLLLALTVAAAAPPPQRVLVLDFRSEGDVAKHIAPLVRDEVAAQLGKRKGLHVLAADDLRNAAALEGERRALGCDADAACMAELAGAMDADVVISGSVGKLGDTILIHVNAFDARRATSAGRESIRVDTEGAIPAALDAAMERLVPGDDGANPLVLAGAAMGTAGAIAAIGGGTIALLSAAAMDDVNGDVTLKGLGYNFGAPIIAITALGAVLAGGGAALIGVGLAP